MFLVNSRQGYFRCDPSPLRVWGSPYCELTDTFLPSSFRSFHPFTLVYYHTNPPVSVCGTDPHSLTLRAFLGRMLFRIPSHVGNSFRNTSIHLAAESHATNRNPIICSKYYSSSLFRKIWKGWNIHQLSIAIHHLAHH